ncbi:MAG: mannosyltransferase [Bacteroidia bacterium]
MSNFKKHLHVVSFDVPFPPNYGGVIDVFYKLKALKELGVQIVLHTWQYGDRKEQPELNNICEKVFYYKRNRFMNPFSGTTPYIVKTRYSQDLVSNLNIDNAPVLFEGLHTTAPLYYERLLPSKKVMIRNHNIESDYYRLLADKEARPFKKAYLKHDAKLLKRYEIILAKANYVAAISRKDHNQLKPNCNSVYIPAFHPNQKVGSQLGKGNYCLYHGNLAVAENGEAATWLVNEVFSRTNKKLVIAGNKASSNLKKIVSQHRNIELKENLSIDEFDQLIKAAQINILPTFQPTGIKLKLLNALYKGRFCLVNDFMVKDSGLEQLTERANSATEFLNSIEAFFERNFSVKEINERKEILETDFSNLKGAKQIVELLF